MCGIAGIIDQGLGLGRAEISRLTTMMRDSMVHRGPDDGATWTSDDGRVALAHRRLSILDLRPEGRQPMGNEDGTVQVVFNGEIYNHRALRDRLEQQGHVFRSRSDTEVLCHLFEDTDLTQCEELDGMFAFAAWNARERKLVLARDAFGKKPLYLVQGANFFAFSSELRALEVLPFVDRTIARDALASYLLVQYVPGPRIMVMVSKFDHCLVDLLYRWRNGEIQVDIPLIGSNHPDCEDVADRYGIPYVHLPVTPATKTEQEAAILRLVEEHRIELVVLARYMQILSNDLCRRLAGRAINIHHSFLPGFKGARPYHQAHDRGVKLVGATAHYVTADLDEGPIIEQDVVRVTHAQTAEQLTRLGQDVERQVLSRAVRYWAENRILLVGHKTVVFP